jgi:lincosamide nucleotidyltransferase A/C/D/E
MMTAADVHGVLDLLAEQGVAGWVDGGWGVDALLGEQSRPHDDLDLVVEAGTIGVARAALLAQGFTVQRDWLPTALALRHADARAVDLHPVAPSADGGGDQTLLDGGRFHYGPPVEGVIAGRRVRCVAVESQLRCHLGYQPDDDDRADMRRLSERYGIALPPPYDA